MGRTEANGRHCAGPFALLCALHARRHRDRINCVVPVRFLSRRKAEGISPCDEYPMRRTTPGAPWHARQNFGSVATLT